MSFNKIIRPFIAPFQNLLMFAAAVSLSIVPGVARGQSPRSAGKSLTTHARERTPARPVDSPTEPSYTFRSRADSLSWARARAVAAKAKGYRVVVSLKRAHLWAIIGHDTVLSAPVSVAKGTTLEFGKQRWQFDTPRGVRVVRGKEADPIWQPPEWLYAETAQENGLKLGHVNAGQKIRIGGGRFLTVKGDEAGVIENGVFAALPTNEHIVFNNTLYVPPLGSKNRKVEGELGKYRLDMGDGFLLHGTPYNDSIGMAATHGCVRMRDEDIEWLYRHVPVRTKVYIY